MNFSSGINRPPYETAAVLPMKRLTDICRQRRDVPITAVCSAPISKIKDSRNLPKDFSSRCGWFRADYDTLMKTAELSPVMSQLIAHRKSCFDHCRIRMKTSEFFRSANYPYPSNKKAVRRIKSGKRPFQYALVPGGRLNARRLLLAAGCGGSNGYNRRMFKKYLADFAMEAGLEIHVCHYPPGCSKDNKIERRLFSQIPSVCKDAR